MTRACALEVRRLARRLERDLRRAVREVLAEIFNERASGPPALPTPKRWSAFRAGAGGRGRRRLVPKPAHAPAQVPEPKADRLARAAQFVPHRAPELSEQLDHLARSREALLEEIRAPEPALSFLLGDVVDVALESKILRGRIVEKKPGDFYRVEPLPIGYQWKPKIVHASEIEALVIAGV